MPRLVRIAAVAILVAAALSTAAASGAQARTEADTLAPGIKWGPCSDPTLQSVGGAQCTHIAVPLDYADPGGQQIELAVSRIQHSAQPYRGVILVNPGGPGASGLSLNASLVLNLYSEGFGGAAAQYDWIGFDPRGVGASMPALSCIRGYFGPDRPSYIPSTPRLLTYWLTASSRYAQACETRSPLQFELLRHMATVDVARDMDQIRIALEQSQISYYGFSYGTYLGQVYATLFPDRVRRLILDSNVDPTRIPYQSFNLDQDAPFNRNENLWFGWLARYHSTYHLGRTQDAVRSLFYATERALRRHPADGQIGPDEWVDIFVGAGYYEQTWGDLGTAFARWVHHRGRAAAQSLVGLYLAQDTPADDNSYAVYLAVACTDAAWPTRWSTWSRDLRRVDRVAPFLAWQNAWFNAPCIYWPVPPLTQVRVNGRQIPGALLIDETLDAATPFEGSLVVRRLFPHSVLLAEPGGTSHADSLSGDACVDRTIAAYLVRGVLPRRRSHARWDKTCAPLRAAPPGGSTDLAQRDRARPVPWPSNRFSVPLIPSIP